MPKPDEFRDFRRHAEWAIVVATAHELGVLAALAPGTATAAELAEQLSLDRRGTEILLGALREFGFVFEAEGRFGLTGAARARFVDRDTPDFQGDWTLLWLDSIRRYAAGLAGAVATGRPAEGAGNEEEEERPAPEDDDGSTDIAGFMAAMANKEPDLVRAVAERCLELAPGAKRLLDVGGGPGSFARAFVERGLRVVLLDRPEVVEFVAEAHELSRVAGLDIVAGDFLDALPDETFDIVLLANVSHLLDRDDNRRLLRRATEALSAGGVLAIVDFVRGTSEFAALFAVTMLLRSQEGNTYSATDYEAWLRETGLDEVQLVALDADVRLVAGRKPDG